MKDTFIALVLFSSLALAAPSSDTVLCARIGVQTPFGAAQVRREVRFQLCTPDGTPLNRPVNLELSVMPLTGLATPGILSVVGVSSDSQGRFSFTYGGSVTPGTAVSEELHRFLLDGRVIASFVLRQTPDGVEFMRAPENLAGIGEGEAQSKILQDARLSRRILLP